MIAPSIDSQLQSMPLSLSYAMVASCTLTNESDQTRLGLMKVVNIQAAKTHLSRLLEEAAAGEEIVLAKAGRPYVKLVPCGPATTPRVLGGWEGKVQIAEDFDEPDARIEKMFEGRDRREGRAFDPPAPARRARAQQKAPKRGAHSSRAKRP